MNCVGTAGKLGVCGDDLIKEHFQVKVPNATFNGAHDEDSFLLNKDGHLT